MEAYINNPAIYVPILIFIAGMGAYLIYNKWFKKPEPIPETLPDTSPGEEPGAETDPVKDYINKMELPDLIPVFILDDQKAMFYDAEITKEEATNILATHKTLGRQFDRDGEKVYYINIEKDGKKRPVPLPKGISNSPTGLYDDMQHPEVAILYDVTPEGTLMSKYGQLLWWVAVIGFIVMLAIQSD